MNSFQKMNQNNSSMIQLSNVQLTRIFEQLGYPGAQIAPYAQVYLQLEPFQIQSMKSSTALSIPMSVNSQSPTVESIISTTTPTPVSAPRISREFVRRLANQLQISESELIDVIQDPNSGNIQELTRRLNEIFNNNMINPPLTEEEVRGLVLITLPSSR